MIKSGDQQRGLPLAELLAEPDELRDWGPWTLDVNGPDDPYPVLATAEPHPYEIDLRRCRTSAEVLDWIIQLTAKDWADNVLAGLLRALDDVLDPQATLCSFGTSTELTDEQITKRAYQARLRRDRHLADSTKADR